MNFRLISALHQGNILALPVKGLSEKGILVKSGKTNQCSFVALISRLKKAVVDLGACKKPMGICMRRFFTKTDFIKRFTEHDLKSQDRLKKMTSDSHSSFIDSKS
jgi:hypothetical protein